ncbi:sulfur carrier protein ThiS [Nibricoccus sp. IMCC34717]|uniref:sulfur carrier protein ThiS n=1 Tax=Nibricoccus sp. IMCC34717 TaxID=3034021 RepID=UPI003850399C
MSDRSPRIQVRVNDRPHELSTDATIASLLGELGLGERRGIAVAVGEEVVPRSRWPQRALTDGEQVIVIQATQGG